MALTQISTAGVKDDAVTAGKIPANAVGSSELADNAVDTAAIADQAVDLTKLPHGTGSNDGKFLRANNGADPTFETVSTDLVADTSPQLGGDLASNSNDILMADTDKIKCGTGTDFELFHNGSSNNTEINHINNSGHMQIASNRLKLTNYDGPETYIDCISNGAVELYHDNAKKIETGTNYNYIYGIASGNPAGLAVRNTNNASDYDHASLRLESKNNAVYGTVFTDKANASLRLGYETTGNTFNVFNDGTVRAAGMKFGSDTAAANALDDYEEGTWTPVWSDATSGGTSATINQIHARYTKVGRVVNLHFYTWSIASQGTSNAIYLQGLPFTVQGSMSFVCSVAGRYFNQGDDNQYNLTLRVNGNNTHGNLEWSESHSGDAVQATFAGIVNAYTNFTGTLTYLTDS